MKKKLSVKPIFTSGLLVFAALMLAVTPMQVWAIDSDGDGFTDDIDSPNGLPPNDQQCFADPGYEAGGPDSPDAFVILYGQPNGWFGNVGGWEQLLMDDTGQGGLSMHVHPITSTDGSDPCPDRNIYCYDRQCNDYQKAAALVEDTFNNVGQQLGWCPQGTFNLPAEDCSLWPIRVYNEIVKVCGARHPGPDCQDTAGNTGRNLELRYYEWVIRHELGHHMDITRCYDATNNGNHHEAGFGCIQDMAPTALDKRGTVTFTFPDAFCAQCQQAFNLAIDDPNDLSACNVVEDVKSGGKKK